MPVDHLMGIEAVAIKGFTRSNGTSSARPEGVLGGHVV